MVKLEEVSADHVDDDLSPDEDDEDDDFSDYSDDDDDRDDESFIDRIYALRDIIPLKRRDAIAQNASRIYGWGKAGISFAGKSAWVLTTTMLLLVLPLALEIEKEQALIAYEKEAQMQQQGAQQMLTPNIYGQSQPGQPQQSQPSQPQQQKGIVPHGF
ncbi:mitochondrial outer membrane translocase complex, subunit Tom22 [Jimgerdemannia flammicorona]|nr:mitochondrial outer membrane translocase complex, subunit Tom22 [Jimgerdemannia flammicorona]